MTKIEALLSHANTPKGLPILVVCLFMSSGQPSQRFRLVKFCLLPECVVVVFNTLPIQELQITDSLVCDFVPLEGQMKNCQMFLQLVVMQAKLTHFIGWSKVMVTIRVRASYSH